MPPRLINTCRLRTYMKCAILGPPPALRSRAPGAQCGLKPRAVSALWRENVLVPSSYRAAREKVSLTLVTCSGMYRTHWRVLWCPQLPVDVEMSVCAPRCRGAAAVLETDERKRRCNRLTHPIQAASRATHSSPPPFSFRVCAVSCGGLRVRRGVVLRGFAYTRVR